MGASPRRGGKRLSGAYWTRPRLFPSNSIRWASERPRRSSHHTMSTPQRGPRGSVGALIEEVRFAADSLVEGAGFEPSVPLAKELLFLERKCRKRRGSRRRIVGLPIVLGRSSAGPAQIRLPSRFEATRRGLRTSGFRATDRAADNRNLIVGSSSKIAVAR